MKKKFFNELYDTIKISKAPIKIILFKNEKKYDPENMGFIAK